MPGFRLAAPSVGRRWVVVEGAARRRNVAGDPLVRVVVPVAQIVILWTGAAAAFQLKT